MSSTKITGSQLSSLIGWQNGLREKARQANATKYSKMLSQMDDGDPRKRALNEMIASGVDLPENHPLVKELTESYSNKDKPEGNKSERVVDALKKLRKDLESFGIADSEAKKITNKRTKARVERLLSMAHLLMREVQKVENEEFGDR